MIFLTAAISAPPASRRTACPKVGAVLGHYRTGRFFEVRSTDLGLPWRRKAKFIREDTALDGFYIIRTSVGPELLSAEEGVKVYKELSHGETAFRLLNTVDLEARARFGLYAWAAAWSQPPWWTRSIPALRLQAAGDLRSPQGARRQRQVPMAASTARSISSAARLRFRR